MWLAFFHAPYYQTILDLLIISQELFSEIMISFFESVLAGRAEGNGFADFWVWLGERGGMKWIHYLSFSTSGTEFLQLTLLPVAIEINLGFFSPP